MGAFDCTTIPQISIGPGSACGCFAVSDITVLEPPIMPSWIVGRNILVFNTCGDIISTGSTAQVDCVSITQLIEDDRPTSDAIGQVYTMTFTDPLAGEVVVSHTVVAADIVPEDVETSIAEAIAETTANIYAALYAAYLAEVAALGCAPMFELVLGTDPCNPLDCGLVVRSTYPGVPLNYELEVTPNELTIPDFTAETTTANGFNLAEGETSVEVCLSQDTLVCALGSYTLERPNIYRVVLAISSPPGTPENTLYRIDGTSIGAVPVTVSTDTASTGLALAAGFNNAIAVLGADPETAFAVAYANGIYLYLTQDFIDTYAVDLSSLSLEECALDGVTCAAATTAAISASTVPYVGALTGTSLSARVCEAWMPMLQTELENWFVQEAKGCATSPCIPMSARIFSAMNAVRVLLSEGDYEGAAEVLSKAKIDYLPSNPCAPVTRCP